MTKQSLEYESNISPPPFPSYEDSGYVLLPIFLIVLVDVFGMTLVLPLLALYAEQFGATPLQATLLISVFAACQLISGPILGKLSDRIGRKPLLLLSQIGTLLGFILMARATALWVVYVSRIIDGSTAGNLSLAQAHIADKTSPKNRAKAFALIGIAFGVGFFIGPSLTGMMVPQHPTDPSQMRAPIYLAAAMSALSILCTATLLRAGRPVQAPDAAHAGASGPGGKRLSVLDWSSYVQYFRRPGLSGLLLAFFFFMFCFSIFTSGFALFAERRFMWNGHPFGVRQIGYVFGYVGLLGIILQGGLIGRLVRACGEKPLIIAGFAALVIGYFCMGLIHMVWLLLIVAAIASFGHGVLRPTMTSLITQNVGRHEQGVVLGLMQSLTSVAAIIAPTLAGRIIEQAPKIGASALANAGKNPIYLTVWAWAAASAAAVGLIIARMTAKSVHDENALASPYTAEPVSSVSVDGAAAAAAVAETGAD